MELELKIAGQICDAFQTYRGEGHHIIFSQLVPDATTSVEIYMRPDGDGKYNIGIMNDRTDAKFNSTPITEIFSAKLPELKGRLKVFQDELLDILTSLLIIEPKKRYFGIRIYIKDDNDFSFRLNLDDLS